MIVVGAIDRRVKCVVAQVPLISGHHNARRLIRADTGPACSDVRRRPARADGGSAAGDDPGRRGGSGRALGAADGGQLRVVHRDRAGPAPRPGGTRSRCVRSKCSPSTSQAPMSRYVSPTPLMMVVALGDHLTVADLALAAYEQRAGAEAAGATQRRPFRRLYEGLRTGCEACCRRVVEHLGKA